MPPYAIHIFILISMIASLLAWQKPPAERYLRAFTLFLLLTLLVESLTLFLLLVRNPRAGLYSNILYNVFSPVEFSFYFFVLHEIIRNRRVKNLITHVIWIYILLVVLNTLFIQKITSFPSITYALGCVVIVSISIYYFFELFQISSAVNLTRQPAFWICSGLLFYYACTFPIFCLTNFVESLPHVFIRNIVIIIGILNLLLYSSFTVAFLCRLKTRKSMS